MQITGQTKVMFVLADPIGHVRGCKTIGGKAMLDEQMGLVSAFLRA